MPKTKLILPNNFNFITEIPIRITDLNYGGHVGNDSVLSLIHEARVKFLNHHGYTELDMAGIGLIMTDTTIEFKQELFYGEPLRAAVAASEFSKVGFELYYRLEKQVGEKWISVVHARTGMVCFNYSLKKIAPLPSEVPNKLLS